MKRIALDWNLDAPISGIEYRNRVLMLLPFAVAAYATVWFADPFVSMPLMTVVFLYGAQFCHRRYLDLLGPTFYSGVRLVCVWLFMMGFGMIPVLGPVLVLWVMIGWDRKKVQEVLVRFFELAESI